MNRTLRSIRMQGLRVAAAGVSVLGASVAQAQWGGNYPVSNGGRANTQLVFEWQGQVDRETQINVGRGNVTVHGVQNNESRGRFSSRGTLPRGSGTLYVQRIDGRGNVDVIQQPGQNGSGDGIIRIRDTQGGAGYYTIRAYWQPNGNTTAGRDGTYGRDGTWYPNGSNGYPNGSANGQNGRYDRDGDGDYDRSDRRIQQADKKAEQARRKAEHEREKARRKAERENPQYRW